MNSTIKRIFLVIFLSFFLKSCVIHDPKPQECEVVEITVTEISEGSWLSYDIVLKDAGTDYYYINRGLEQGLSIEDLREKILNKKVTLHLPKLMIVQSEHIAQLALNKEVIFTEFN